MTSSYKANAAEDLEHGIQRLGAAFLNTSIRFREKAGWRDQWVGNLLRRINQNPDFRVQALRFIDVLPALQDDAELLAHFEEHFSAQEFPLPGLGRLISGAGRAMGRRALAAAVRGVTTVLSGQYMGGESAAALEPVLEELRTSGRGFTLDLLGELTLSDHEANRYQQAYLKLMDEFAAANPDQPLHLSIKVSSLQPRIQPHRLHQDTQRVLPRLLPLLHQARSQQATVTLDIEDYDKRPLIFQVMHELLFSPEFRDWPGLGIALQAYLQDADADLTRLLDWAKRRQTPFMVRLVRGAYWDQENVIAALHGWPTPVYQQQAATDHQYEQCLQRLMSAWPLVRPAIATHNPRSLAAAMALAEQHNLDKAALEFQMLYGMAEHYQQALVDMGYTLRVYLPFGEPIPGMAYLVRRLLENAQSQSLERMDLDTTVSAAELLRPPAVIPTSTSRIVKPLNPLSLEGEGQGEGVKKPVVTSPPLPDPLPLAGERGRFAGGSAGGFQNEPPRRFTAEEEREGFQAAIDQVQNQLGGHIPLLLAGSFQASGDSITSFDPSSADRLVGSTASADPNQVELALRSATQAFPGWRDTPVAERAALLRRAADQLHRRRDEFAAWEIFEAGKNWIEADADVCEAIDFLRFYANEAERLAEPTAVDLPGEENRHFFQPRGVGVVIPPWNFPLAILTGMLSATLVSGNCAILKPSSDTPVVAGRFVQLLYELGFPEGVLQFLPGAGDTVGEQLVRHPGTHLIAFTGSRAVGTGILQRANVLQPRQRHIKKVIAELGGKNAIIVDTSADPDEAIAGILQSAFGYQGQKCSACSRVIVVGRQYDGLVKRLCEAAESLCIEAPRRPESELGPVINAAAKRRILAAIEQGKQHGRLVYQADVNKMESGHYVGPAVFRDVDPDSPLAQEEIFGPVLATLPARDFDTALQIANGTAYALTGGVYSRSPANLRKASKEFRVGNLYLNRGITGALVGRQPFGGFKLSGTASKAGGRDYLQLFMEPRCVTENTLRRGVAPEPD